MSSEIYVIDDICFKLKHTSLYFGLHLSPEILLTVLAMIIQEPKSYISFNLKDIGGQVRKMRLQRDIYRAVKDLGYALSNQCDEGEEFSASPGRPSLF